MCERNLKILANTFKKKTKKNSMQEEMMVNEF